MQWHGPCGGQFLGEGMDVLDVFLRGERDYVQGTQLIARVADTLETGAHVFRQAEFHRKTVNLVACAPDGADGLADVVGKVHFQTGPDGDARSFALCELPEPAPRLDRTMPVRITRRSGPDAGNADAQDPSVWDWIGVSGFEDVLNAIVQIIRAEHGIRWPGSRDVWLTGFRRCNLPVATPDRQEGTFNLVLGRRLAGGATGTDQTIWQFTLPELGLSGTSTFAFKLSGT